MLLMRRSWGATALLTSDLSCIDFRSVAVVTEPAEKLCSESVRPYLDSVLEELMEPISSGFQEGRQLMESLMDEVCQSVQQGDKEDAWKVRSHIFGENLRCLDLSQPFTSVMMNLELEYERSV